MFVECLGTQCDDRHHLTRKDMCNDFREDGMDGLSCNRDEGLLLIKLQRFADLKRAQ